MEYKKSIWQEPLEQSIEKWQKRSVDNLEMINCPLCALVSAKGFQCKDCIATDVCDTAYCNYMRIGNYYGWKSSETKAAAKAVHDELVKLRGKLTD